MIGTNIGSYRITAKLGEGGMGEVFVGEHTRIDRKVAVKLLRPEASANPDVLIRFFNEAKATSRIHHPGIVEMLDCDVLPDGRAYLLMELLAGETLGQWLRAVGAVGDMARVVSLGQQVAAAVGAAHERGIVHRDLKPDNVFMLEGARHGAFPAVKVLDFGIAKLLDHGGRTTSTSGTRTGAVLGTPIYMSPEQCRGSGQVDHRTDIYSLGCLLFEMCCGRPPFLHEGAGELIAAHITETPPEASALSAAVPPQMSMLLAELLAKDPAQRPPSMAEVQARLAAIDCQAAGPPGWTPLPRTVSLPVTPLPPSRTITTLGDAARDLDTVPVRPRRRLWGGGLAGLLIAAGVWLVLGTGHRPAVEPLRVQATTVVSEPPPRAFVPEPAPVMASPDAGVAAAAPVPAARPRPRPRPRPRGPRAEDLDGLAQ
jgi:serine/threonine protein kinase